MRLTCYGKKELQMKEIISIIGFCLFVIGVVNYKDLDVLLPINVPNPITLVKDRHVSIVSNKVEDLQTNVSKIEKETSMDLGEIIEKTKQYLLSGQGDKPEARKLKWSASFLDQVNIESVYEEYLKSGGEAGAIPIFAEYLTLNAPIDPNWQEMIKATVSEDYGYDITKFEPLSQDTYQAYVMLDGKEVPYVVVNARTGYFHG